MISPTSSSSGEHPLTTPAHTVLVINTPPNLSTLLSDPESHSEGDDLEQEDEIVQFATRPTLHNDDEEDGEEEYEEGESTGNAETSGSADALLFRWTGNDESEEENDEDDDEGWERPINTYRSSSETTRRSHSHGLTKGQQRRIYGGGRHGENAQGGMSIWGVAGLILAGSATPTPLLFPHAIALLGLPLFIPLVCVTVVLCWFAYVAIGIEARYCGSRSWPALASSVFPHRFKSHKLGELITSAVVIFCSIGRGLVAVVLSGEILVDLFMTLPKTTGEGRGSSQQERMIAVGIISLIWTLIPLVILPVARICVSRRRRSSAPNVTSLLPAYISLFMWPIALLILGVRLKTLNVESLSDVVHIVITAEEERREAMGLSISAGLSILIFSLSSHYDAFRYITSLARPVGRIPTPATPTTSASPLTSTSTRNSDKSQAKRNQWPLAAGVGVGLSMLIHLGWGLVGYLGVKGGGREANLFAAAALPLDDNWISFVKLLVLVAILSGIEGNLDASYGRIIKLLSLTGVEIIGGTMGLRGSTSSYAPLNYAAEANGIASGGGAEEEGRNRSSSSSSSRQWDWKAFVARLSVWSLIAGIGMIVCAQGENGEGVASVAEIVGCIGGSLMAFLGPSLFFIALFHLRRPRSIFIADPSAPAFVEDALLVRKEREVQRRLSGRRLYIDALVFGGLLPFGTIALVRGCLELAR